MPMIKTHLIVTGQWEEYDVKWCGRLIDTNPVLKNGMPTFVIITGLPTAMYSPNLVEKQ